MRALFSKDLRNALFILWPSLLWGLPLSLLLHLLHSEGQMRGVEAREAFWLIFYLGAIPLFYRSFSLEHRSRNFQIYSSLGVSPVAVLWSQSLVQTLSLIVLSLGYGLLTLLFFSPPFEELLRFVGIAAMISMAIAPLATALGLLLQLEREFLFGLFFLPLSLPLFLAAHSLTTTWSWAWFSVPVAFLMIGGFIASLLFEFFFDELSQSL